MVTNLKDLEAIIQRKQMNARTIEEGRFQFLIYLQRAANRTCYSSETKDHGRPGATRPSSAGMRGTKSIENLLFSDQNYIKEVWDANAHVSNILAHRRNI